MKIVNFLMYNFIRTTFFIVQFVPMSFTFWWVRKLAKLVYPFMERRRALMLYNLEQALGDTTTPEEREEIAWKSFENLFIAFGELVHMDAIHARWDDHFTTEGTEIVERYIKEGKGFFVFGGHFGGWTMPSPAVHLFPDAPGFNMVAKPLRNPKMQEFFDYFVRKQGGKLISTRGTGHMIEEALKNGELVGLYMDQESRRGQGVFVNFFGREASSHVVPGYLAWKNGAPLIPYWIPRVAPGKFHVIFREPLEYELTDDVEENNRRVAQAIAGEVERTIREHPEQWLWSHNRWRRRPDGTRVELFDKDKKKGSRTKKRKSGAYLSSEDVAKKLKEEEARKAGEKGE